MEEGTAVLGNGRCHRAQAEISGQNLYRARHHRMDEGAGFSLAFRHLIAGVGEDLDVDGHIEKPAAELRDPLHEGSGVHLQDDQHIGIASRHVVAFHQGTEEDDLPYAGVASAKLPGCLA